MYPFAKPFRRFLITLNDWFETWTHVTASRSADRYIINECIESYKPCLKKKRLTCKTIDKIKNNLEKSNRMALDFILEE